MSVHAIVLAAGKGTRMKSDLAKVLHTAAGRTLLDWSLDALQDVDADSIAVVVGHQAAAVTASIADHELAPLIATALQAEQLGTGHATGVGLAALQWEPDDTVIVLPGDMPLLQPASIAALVERHRSARAAATVATARVRDPSGYGRIKRDGGRVVAIVEQSDATPAEAAIDEINTSVYAFDAAPLASSLSQLDDENAQGEQYLTDVIGLLASSGAIVEAVVVTSDEAAGVNTLQQLAAAAAKLGDDLL